MVKQLRIAAALFLMAALSIHSSADTFLSAGLIHENQDYREFSSLGKLLDQDRGHLYGSQLQIGWNTENLQISLNYQNIQGTLSYDSISAKSHVDAHEYITELEVQRRIFKHEKQTYLFTAGLGINKRIRNIASTGSLSGLNETYTHKYGAIGVKFRYDFSLRSNLYLIANYQQDFEADLDVAFVSQVFDPITFPLAQRSGYDLQAELEYQLTQEWQFVLNLTTSINKSKRSKSFRLSKNTVLTNNSVSEPANESSTLATRISIERHF